MRPITIAGAGSAFVILLLAFAMIGASNVALPEPNILASTDPTRETFSVSDAKPFNPNNPRITDEDNRQTHVPTEGHERNFFRVASQQSELLPTEKSSSQVAVKNHLRDFTELTKSYPKERATSETRDTSGHQPGKGRAARTVALHFQTE